MRMTRIRMSKTLAFLKTVGDKFPGSFLERGKRLGFPDAKGIRVRNRIKNSATDIEVPVKPPKTEREGHTQLGLEESLGSKQEGRREESTNK